MLPLLSSPGGPINRPSPGCGSALRGSQAPAAVSSQAPASMASEFKKKLFWRAVVAEFLAMILFIVISIGSALGFNFPLKNNQTSGAAQDNVKVSLAFGLSIATMAQSVGHISGAHLNPAVTLGLLLSCQISVLRAVLYIIAQCVGAIVATAILSGITSSLPGNSLGSNAVSRVGFRVVLTRPHPPPIGQMGTLRSREDKRWPEITQSWGWNSAPHAAQSRLPAGHWEAEAPRITVLPTSPEVIYCGDRALEATSVEPAAPHLWPVGSGPSALTVQPAPCSCSLDAGTLSPCLQPPKPGARQLSLQGCGQWSPTWGTH